MSYELTTFNAPEGLGNVRVVTIEGEPWFVFQKSEHQ